jgi:hypothetical protein
MHWLIITACVANSMPPPVLQLMACHALFKLCSRSLDLFIYSPTTTQPNAMISAFRQPARQRQPAQQFIKKPPIAVSPPAEVLDRTYPMVTASQSRRPLDQFNYAGKCLWTGLQGPNFVIPHPCPAGGVYRHIVNGKEGNFHEKDCTCPILATVGRLLTFPVYCRVTEVETRGPKRRFFECIHCHQEWNGFEKA